MRKYISGFIILVLFGNCRQPEKNPVRICLNGEWEISKTTSFSEMPSVFTSKTTIPGLVDMAIPPIDQNKNYDNGIYWHKTNFTIDKEIPGSVKLKIGKVKYHARVFLNNEFVGEQLYCFSSASFDIRRYLNPRGEENELMIATGTFDLMPDTVIWGNDFEKITYIPGIYDNVELILSGFLIFGTYRLYP